MSYQRWRFLTPSLHFLLLFKSLPVKQKGFHHREASLWPKEDANVLSCCWIPNVPSWWSATGILEASGKAPTSSSGSVSLIKRLIRSQNELPSRIIFFNVFIQRAASDRKPHKQPNSQLRTMLSNSFDISLLWAKLEGNSLTKRFNYTRQQKWNAANSLWRDRRTVHWVALNQSASLFNSQTLRQNSPRFSWAEEGWFLTSNMKACEDCLYPRYRSTCSLAALFTVEVCPILLLAYWKIQSSGCGPLTELAEAPRRDTRSSGLVCVIILATVPQT